MSPKQIFQSRDEARRQVRQWIARAFLAAVAGFALTAAAADFDHRTRQVDKSAERAIARAQAAASEASAPAGAASAPAGAASSTFTWNALPHAAIPAASSASRAKSGAEASTDVSLQVGGAWNGNRQTRTWTTPFTLSVDRGEAHGELNGDGQTHKSGAKPGTGFGDVSALGSYNVVVDPTFVMTPAAQWTFPTGGAIGSHRSSQEISLLFEKQLPRCWGLERYYVSVEPIVDRDTEDAARAAEYGKSVDAKLTWKQTPNGNLDTYVKFERARPAGDRKKTKLSITHDFDITQKLDGSLALGRSLAGSESVNSAEFDLTWNF
jgi:hypothetical protein